MYGGVGGEDPRGSSLSRFNDQTRDAPHGVTRSFRCRKGSSEAKHWLDVDAFEAIEAHAYNMSPADKSTVRRIIFEHFDYIVSEWRKFQEKKNG